MEGLELGEVLEDGGVDGDGGGFGGHDDGGYQFSSMGEEVRLSAPSYLAKLVSLFCSFFLFHCMLIDLVLLVLATVG